MDALQELIDMQPGPVESGHIKYYPDLVQGTDEWFEVRRGLLTASEMNRIITEKKLEPANNETARKHVLELAAQRISGHVEPSYINDDMMRGLTDEVEAGILYGQHYAALTSCGFITNDKWGFKIGYSPDALVGDDGLIEVKSRLYKYQIETILNYQMPPEYMIQVQTGLLVSERSWCDFISYPACGGLPMLTLRIFPDEKIQQAIVNAAQIFHQKIDEAIEAYNARLKQPGARFIQTERREEQEIVI